MPAAGGGDYFGRFQRNNETLTLENLISHIQEHETNARPRTIQYRAGIPKTEMLRQLAMGGASRILDLCTVYLVVRGAVSDVLSLVVRCTASAEVRAVADGLSVANVVKADIAGSINKILDVFTGTENATVTRVVRAGSPDPN